jgi:hypothetical protein
MMAETKQTALCIKDKGKATEKDYTKRLFDILYQKPISRRMAATLLGYPDQTYMTTQFINDWIKEGKAQVVGSIKCVRSGRMVEAITTNPKFFKKRIKRQLELFSQ